ncbi:MAG: hypothetical protein L3J71_09720 [Victivallaceae bacterium]|nr:hypothetical protein [Victivallaceae bacterium]
MVDNKTSESVKLMANLVYDISNPNNSIMMNTELLEDVFKDAIALLKDDSGQLCEPLAGIPPDRIEEAVKDLFAGIKEGAKRIQDVSDNLKRFS